MDAETFAANASTNVDTTPRNPKEIDGLEIPEALK